MGSIIRPIKVSKFKELIRQYDEQRLKGPQIVDKLTKAGYGTPSEGIQFAESTLSYWRKKTGLRKKRKFVRKPSRAPESKAKRSDISLNQVEEILTCNLPDNLKLRFITSLVQG